MKKTFVFLFITVLFTVFQCTQVETFPPSDKDVTATAYQIPGCLSGGLNKLQTDSLTSGCFTYSFADTLSLNFCVYGNCCPDSNRFVTDVKLKNDTIFVAVSDTAREGCYCFCQYEIHLDITGLHGNEYLFYCDYKPSASGIDTLKYREAVRR